MEIEDFNINERYSKQHNKINKPNKQDDNMEL